MSTLNRAIAIASEAHAGQVDKGGEPYILHPIRVMLAMKSEVGRIVGVLHDVIEDSPKGPEVARQQLVDEDFDVEVLAALGFLYRPKIDPRLKGEPAYDAYIDRLFRLGPALAIAVKLADLNDNLCLKRLARHPDEKAAQLLTRYRVAHRKLSTTSRDIREL